MVGQPVRLVGEPDSGSAQDDAPVGRLLALVVADADDGHEIEVPLLRSQITISSTPFRGTEGDQTGTADRVIQFYLWSNFQNMYCLPSVSLISPRK